MTIGVAIEGSAVKGRRGTWARRAEARPQPPREYTQAESLERRRNGLPVILGGGWFLHDDVAAICGSLAEQITAAPHSSRFLRTRIDTGAGHLVGDRHPSASIDDLALAIHGVAHAVVGFLEQANAEHKTRHLSGDQRARAKTIIRTLATRPELPEFDRTDAHSGAWVTALVDLCKPYSAPLADLLGRTPTTDLSNRLIAELRDVDRVARALQRRLDRDAALRAERAARPAPAPTEADHARAELAELGVTL